jgi:hypothetical protein
MTFQEALASFKSRIANVMRSHLAAGLVGCVLAALGVAAALFGLAAPDPLVASLAVLAAVWLAWIAADFALAPLRAAHTGTHRRMVECTPDRPLSRPRPRRGSATPKRPVRSRR